MSIKTIAGDANRILIVTLMQDVQSVAGIFAKSVVLVNLHALDVLLGMVVHHQVHRAAIIVGCGY